MEIDKSIPKLVRFKPYEIGENLLFPPTTDEYIPKTHIARLISLIIDKMDINFILETYKGGGASSYSPRMMLKVWMLGFIYRIYTSRKLELALEENLPFIWISAGQTPDFRSLNNFRIRLKDEIKKIFKQIVRLGMELGMIAGKDVFVDHTKIEANANKHKITWKKNVTRQLGKIEDELEGLFEYIDEMNEKEDKKYGDNGIKDKETSSLDVEKIDKIISKLNEEIKKQRREKEDFSKTKEMKDKLRRTKELWNKSLGYQMKKQVLGDRNSFSNTDPDATAMMQKDKVSIKPSYNEGIAVENGFVINYEVNNKCADNINFKDVVSGAMENIEGKIENVHADAAYGNEENSEYLEKQGINNYLKFNTYQKEKSKKWYQEKVRKESFLYDANGDYYTCVNGVKLSFHELRKDKTATGYKIELRIYIAEEGKCPNCPYQKYCTNSKRRMIQISEKYEKHKGIMSKNLESEKGKELRKRRGNEVESIFGDRKYNRNYQRYILREKNKVKIESELYYTTHNIRKIYQFIIKNWYRHIYAVKQIQLSQV